MSQSSSRPAISSPVCRSTARRRERALPANDIAAVAVIGRRQLSTSSRCTWHGSRVIPCPGRTAMVVRGSAWLAARTDARAWSRDEPRPAWTRKAPSSLRWRPSVPASLSTLGRRTLRTGCGQRAAPARSTCRKLASVDGRLATVERIPGHRDGLLRRRIIDGDDGDAGARGHGGLLRSGS